MSTLIAFIIGLMIGSAFAVLVIAVLQAGRDDE